MIAMKMDCFVADAPRNDVCLGESLANAMISTLCLENAETQGFSIWTVSQIVIASEAKQSIIALKMDCFGVSAREFARWLIQTQKLFFSMMYKCRETGYKISTSS
jgi:hypothetical protein